jgi:hypothetical protein
MNGDAEVMPGGFEVEIDELGAGFAGLNINGDMGIIEDFGVENMGDAVFEDGVISWDLSPIIIPKWQTLREDLARHRTRSIMSFSIPLNGVFNMNPQLDDWEPQFGLNGNEDANFVPAANGDIPPPGLPPGFQPLHQEPQVGNHVQPMNNGWDAPHAVHNHDTTHQQQNGNDHEGFQPAHIHAQLPAQPDNIHVIDAGPGPVVVPIDGHIQLDINDFDFFGRRATISQHYFDFESHPLELHRTLIAEVILREPPRIVLENGQNRTFSSSPIMSVGGRCAMWVQQNVPALRTTQADGQQLSSSDAAASRKPKQDFYVRLATFPSYEGERDGSAAYHEELDVTAGQVSTVLMPPEIDLEKAIMFDLDDVRGFLGVVTMEEGNSMIWLVDFS